MSAKKAVAEGFADSMLYADANQEEPIVENSFSFSRLAIQNSANMAMQRFFEQWKQLQPKTEPIKKPPKNERLFDLRRKRLDLASKL